MNVQEALSQIEEQLCYILQQLDDSEYACPLGIFEGSSIGKHMRHILDLNRCIIHSTIDEYIDYANRERNERFEKETSLIQKAIVEVGQELAKLDLSKKVNVLQDYNKNGSADRQYVSSTYGRELMYAFDHAVHHIAMIKMGIRSAFPHIKLPDDLGYAPSTIRYQFLSNS